MRTFEICYPIEGEDGKTKNVVERLTEEQIIESYYPFWKNAMEQKGLHHLISRERCLEDWIIVNWAMEIFSDETKRNY